MPTIAIARRPGAPRNEKARLAILRAASELIASDGYDRLTIEGIAARAGVGKPTIYRWWSSKSELIAECLTDQELLPGAILPGNTDDLIADITGWLLAVIQFVSEERNTRLIRSLIAAAVDNRAVATQLRNKLGATPESLDGRLRSAVASGQLAPGTPVNHLSELLIGALILRVIGATGFEDGDAALFARAALSGSLREPPA